MDVYEIYEYIFFFNWLTGEKKKFFSDTRPICLLEIYGLLKSRVYIWIMSGFGIDDVGNEAPKICNLSSHAIFEILINLNFKRISSE